jgi:predicted phosphoribosyltransferase
MRFENPLGSDTASAKEGRSMSIQSRTKRTSKRVFRNRREAGRVLAELLTAYRDQEDVVVLGLARGGIPVAWEVAAELGAPLDAFIVRKLGAPGHEEFAMGALAGGGRVVLNDNVVRALRISPQQLSEATEREGRELQRREVAYRHGRPPLDVTGKTVIIVDDGLATGASMLVAVQAVREARPKKLVVAVPTAPESTAHQFAGIADDVVYASMPAPFGAVGEFYWDFSQVSDEEVRDLLATPVRHQPAPPA